MCQGCGSALSLLFSVLTDMHAQSRPVWRFPYHTAQRRNACAQLRKQRNKARHASKRKRLGQRTSQSARAEMMPYSYSSCFSSSRSFCWGDAFSRLRRFKSDRVKFCRIVLQINTHSLTDLDIILSIRPPTERV